MHYYKFNIADYRKDTGHLSPLEHGIYRLLLDDLYLHEVPLTSDKAKLMRSVCVRTKDEKQAFSLVLKEFFSETEKGFINERVELELSKIYKKSDKARAAAKLRWGKYYAKAMRTQSERNADGMLPHYLTTSLPKDSTNKDMSGKPDERPKLIFDYWLSVMNKKSSAKFTPKRRACIKARLSDGYTADQLKEAIDGCRSSDYHMGDNQTGAVYDDLTLICRSGDKLENFMNMKSGPKGGPGGGPNGTRNQRPARQSLAERTQRQTDEALADIASRRAANSAVGENDGPLRQQVEPDGSTEEREGRILEGVSAVVPEDTESDGG